MISALSKDGREVRAGVFMSGTNAAGAVEMGFHPGISSGPQTVDDVRAKAQVEAVWSASVAAKAGLAGSSLLCSAAHGEVKALYVMGADPATSRSLTPEDRKASETRMPGRDNRPDDEDSRDGPRRLSNRRVLGETGSLTNVAVRVQRFGDAVPPPPGDQVGRRYPGFFGQGGVPAAVEGIARVWREEIAPAVRTLRAFFLGEQEARP